MGEHDDAVLIRGGMVIDPSQALHEERDVLVEGGRIEAVSREISPERAARVIDASGLLVTPGFVDLRAHLREPGHEAAETIETGAQAAARGGFTTVFCAANTEPTIDDPSIVRFITARATQACGTRICPIAAVTLGREGKEMTGFASLLECGAAMFSDAPEPVRNAATLRRALESAKDLGAVIAQQCEDPDLTGSGVMHEGSVSLRLGLHGVPRVSEATVVARDAMLALATGGRLHISQLSNAQTVEVVRHFKDRGAPITAEVSPHHLTLTDHAVLNRDGTYNTNVKVRPPLAEESDRAALVEALKDGVIDAIATCHAPHPPASKDDVFDAAPFGIIGFESAFAVLHERLVATGTCSLDLVIEKLTAGPAGVVGDRAGSLRVGASADLAIIRLGHPYLFDETRVASKGRNCPWLGETFGAGVVATLVGGAVTHDELGIFGPAESVRA